MPDRVNEVNEVNESGYTNGQQPTRRLRSPETGRFLPMPPRERVRPPLRLQRGQGGQQARRQYIAPLFAYCASHGISVAAIGRQAALRRGVVTMSRTRLWRIKNGHAMLPDWFVAGMCREIGQPIETVMGQEWAQQHMPAQPAETLAETLEQRAS